jgi:hypothetical protein
MVKDKFELRFTKTNIRKLIKNMVDIFKPQAKLKRNKLRIKLSSRMPRSIQIDIQRF